jgi:hypothetical protein
MEPANHPTEISPERKNPAQQALRQQFKWIEYAIYSLLLFKAWNSADAALKLKDTAYHNEWLFNTGSDIIGVILCGWLLWKRRSSSQSSVPEMLLAMVLAQAISKTFAFLTIEDHPDFPTTYWLIALLTIASCWVNSRAHSKVESSDVGEIGPPQDGTNDDSIVNLGRRSLITSRPSIDQ